MSATLARLDPVRGTLRWRVDPLASEISVHGVHLGAPWVNGVLRGLAGELILDPADPCGSSFDVTVARERAYVGDPFLNTQLRLADLLRGGGAVRLTGTVTPDAAGAGYAADVYHTLASLPCPLAMAVVLRRFAPLCGGSETATAAARVSLTALPLPSADAPRRAIAARASLEPVRLHLEADAEPS
jgi:hypothetical protein